MALTNSETAGGGTYISLKKGYWGRRIADEGTWEDLSPEALEAKRAELVVSEAVTRKRGGTGENAGEMIWEKRYDTLSGIIKNAYIEEGMFGNNLQLVIEDNGEQFIAQLKADGVLAGSIIKTLPNIDVTKEVFLKAYTNKKDHAALWIEQGGEGVRWAFTKDEPNGLPEPTLKKVKGKDTWDWSDVDNFLYDAVQKWCSQFEGKKEEDSAGDSGFVQDKDTRATASDLPF